ncbi:tRNA-uridine aminocarboxypropyltransferase [Dasania marina]|uniref:tRNA-uridine aminocarboxypropyltransferase n=1 Tax=Dasania marina TaxID=471499 RepID=UPI0003746095|nr:tRNA-uridine aminocarboxypropyltransferase [Dasania marina]
MPRATCPNCQRPLATCYCSALVKLSNNIKVLIIQHPLEATHPFNTGRMAKLCLSNSELIIAETLSNTDLKNMLGIPSALLYPSLSWLPATPEIGDSVNEDAITPAIQQLIVIDASWRKSKKMLHLHPALQNLPRVNLSGGLASQYQIRKTSISNGLSTIESIAQAMQQLEHHAEFKQMLMPFEKMIALQQASYQKTQKKPT